DKTVVAPAPARGSRLAHGRDGPDGRPCRVGQGRCCGGARLPFHPLLLFGFLVSTAALLALVHGEPGPKLRQMQRGQARDLTFMALLGMIGFTALLFEGLKRTSASEAGIITATLPAVVALLGVAVLAERLAHPPAG